MQKQQLNPYQVPGVAPSADAETIKAAYRRKAKALHPDAGGDPDRFAEATLAYDVLMDAKRRKLFDETGKIDQRSDESKEQAARQVLFDMLAHALMGEVNPLNVNLVHQMDNNLQKQIDDHDAKKSLLTRAIDRAEVMKKRFVRKAKKKASEPNIFVELLDRHQSQLAIAREHHDQQQEIKRLALDTLRLYGFDPNGMSNYAIRHYGGPFGSGTTSFLV